MKKYSVFVFIILVFLVSCVPFEKKTDFSQFILVSEKDNPGEILFEKDSSDTIVRWYQCSDENGSDAALIAECETLEIPAFESPEVRYYLASSETPLGAAVSQKMFFVSYTGLPTVFVDTADSKDIRSKRTYSDAVISISDESKPLSQTEIVIKGRGSSSWILMTKKGYTFKFGSKTKVLGMGKSKKWALVANQIDVSKMSNWTASYIANNIFQTVIGSKKQWQADLRFVDLVVNGQYRGIYTLSEVVKLEGNRIDVPDISELTTESADVNLDGVTDLNDGGFVVEFTRDSSPYSFTTLHGCTVDPKDPDFDEVKGSWTKEEIRDHIIRKVNRLECAIFGETGEDYKDLLDLESYVNWFLVNEFMANNEAAFKTSSFLYYDPSISKFVMGPVWDFDRCIINRNPDGFEAMFGVLAVWSNRLYESDPFFRSELARVWSEKRESLIQSFDVIAQKCDEISCAVEFDALRWEGRTAGAASVRAWLEHRVAFMDRLLLSN